MPVFQLNEQIIFPPPHLAEPEGLIAVGGDLSTERLLAAYRVGIFPWYGEGEPILWWTPDPRLVLFPEEFHPARRLLRTVKQNKFNVTADVAFAEVITNCAEQRSPNRLETWITGDMIDAYCSLHELGYAHSIECWQKGILVGGLYGIALGGVFFGESMFSSTSNSSKVALYYLVQHARQAGIKLIDCQIHTKHLISLGAREIPRSKFQKYLHSCIPEISTQSKWYLQ